MLGLALLLADARPSGLPGRPWGAAWPCWWVWARAQARRCPWAWPWVSAGSTAPSPANIAAASQTGWEELHGIPAHDLHLNPDTLITPPTSCG
jgi:hypothetical protein